jgi:hypothetical protein
LRGRIALAALSSTALILMAAGSARAAACNDTWLGGNGNWDTPSDWSNGVPTSTSVACIAGTTNYIVTVTPSAEAQAIQLGGTAGTQTLEVEGQGNEAGGDWYNSVTLSLGTGGLSIDSDGTLLLDATATDHNSGGSPPGGSAILTATNQSAATIVNDGVIDAESSDPSWESVLNFGGTLTNNGLINVLSGTLEFAAASPYMTAVNDGTINVESGSTLSMQAGDGSSFTDAGTYNNDGTTLAAGTMHWNAGGTMTGNPIDFQYHSGSPTLVDTTTSGHGTYLFQSGGFMTGTIPAGQTVEAQGTGGGDGADTSINIDGTTVTNDGTLILDAPGAGTSSGGSATLYDGTVNNYGILQTSVEDPSYHDELQVTLNNETGGTVRMLSGTVDQENGDVATNSGLWQIAPDATYEMYGGGFTNNDSGTLQPQISGAGTYGAVDLVNGTVTAGGTLAPALVSGYTPAAGAEFPIFALNGGRFTGTFAKTTNGFSSDYTHEALTTRSRYVGVVYGATPAASAPAAVRPSARRLTGGAAEIKLTLSCPKGVKLCAKYTVTGKVTEHLKHSRITAVSARAGDKTRKKAKTRVVKVASSSGSLSGGRTKTLTIKLNGAGKSLLKRFGRLKVKVTVTAGDTTVKAATVTVTEAKAKAKAKK